MLLLVDQGNLTGTSAKNDSFFWLFVSRREINVRIFYVESKANMADGPTRGHFELLQFFSAVSVEPVLLPWLFCAG